MRTLSAKLGIKLGMLTEVFIIWIIILAWLQKSNQTGHRERLH